VWLLERILPGAVTLVLWAALAIGSGVYLGALDFSPRSGWSQLWKACGAFAFIYGILLLIGAASGAVDPLRPLTNIGAATVQGAAAHKEQLFVDVDNLEELNSQLSAASAAGKPVFFDFYADWCISCKVMEREVFPDAKVSRLLAQFHLVRADVTEYVDAHKKLLSYYDLPGPPSMIFYSSAGDELTELRISGEMDAAAFGQHLEYILAL
jgi:thiol:disulfide interchange protein DsbD